MTRRGSFWIERHLDSRLGKSRGNRYSQEEVSVETRVLIVENRVAPICRLSKDPCIFWYRCLPKHFCTSKSPVRRLLDDVWICQASVPRYISPMRPFFLSFEFPSEIACALYKDFNRLLCIGRIVRMSSI